MGDQAIQYGECRNPPANHFKLCKNSGPSSRKKKKEKAAFPYSSAVDSLMYAMTRNPVPPSPVIKQALWILLLPDSWKKSGNVPALVRLLQAFLQKAPHELNQEGRLTQVLGIFNKLVTSPSTDEQGFYVLNTVVENLGYDVIAPHMVHIWAALFMRLQNSRTVKFVKSFLIFMSLFLVKHGSQNLVDSMNTVQPNIFLVILEQFWIPNLKMITGSIELKLTSVASTKLICESQALLDPAASRHWGKMLDSIVTLLSRPEQDRVEEEPDVPDFADNVGYGATFVHLYNAGKKEEDPLRDIRDPKQFLVASLANFSARSPGRYPQVISENLDQANQAALLQLFSSYNLSIV
ncbi:exportin-2-like [Actinidia eriantha]|uniref:exportin-2-like n=1 Tax=Actinidia eriantha TaxID=165200 RepID=UPI00258426A0|nr:exportin-2-like [Actinidia eriantha]